MNKYLEKCLKENMPVIFDYDGVLFEARWYEERINMREIGWGFGNPGMDITIVILTIFCKKSR